ncbi:unnamed protein product [Ambrosiozyma monospora]|uniref:Unnamed protein product n=1 Tax=Ambrosiozyma monospora TaxID=43982 RepID=A0ACB5TQ89_AMBMO|nr:unnamed protein product [Ambrosiozyma monospora]
MAGTPYWMAPEVISESAYNVKADIWSLGITVYEMATSAPPYSDKDQLRAMTLITQHEPPRLEGRQYSSLLKEIVAMCLEEKQDLRPAAEDLLKSKFIKTYKQASTSVLKEVISRYLLWRDNQKSGVKDNVYADDNESVVDLGNEDYNVKWDFDSLKSAEYLIENDIDIHNVHMDNNNNTGNAYDPYYTQNNANNTTYRDYNNMRTIGATTVRPGGVTNGVTLKGVTMTNTATKSEAPQSLLGLFDSVEEDEPVKELPPLMKSATHVQVKVPPPTEVSNKEMVPIEIPNMAQYNKQKVGGSGTRSRSATVTVGAAAAVLHQHQNPQQPPPHIPLPATPTSSLSSTQKTLVNEAHSASTSDLQRRPTISHSAVTDDIPSRRPTISHSTLGRRTPSPKKYLENSSNFSSPSKLTTGTPPQMKPLPSSNHQPLLQPINTNKSAPSSAMLPSLITIPHNGAVGNGPQTAPALTNAEFHEQQQQLMQHHQNASMSGGLMVQ